MVMLYYTPFPCHLMSVERYSLIRCSQRPAHIAAHATSVKILLQLELELPAMRTIHKYDTITLSRVIYVTAHILISRDNFKRVIQNRSSLSISVFLREGINIKKYIV